MHSPMRHQATTLIDADPKKQKYAIQNTFETFVSISAAILSQGYYVKVNSLV